MVDRWEEVGDLSFCLLVLKVKGPISKQSCKNVNALCILSSLHYYFKMGSQMFPIT